MTVNKGTVNIEKKLLSEMKLLGHLWLSKKYFSTVYQF